MKQQNKKPYISTDDITRYYAKKDKIEFYPGGQFPLKELEKIIQDAKKLEKGHALVGMTIQLPNLTGVRSKKRKSK